MTYVITFNEKENKFEMDGHLETDIGDHLKSICKYEGHRGLETYAISESHLLYLLRDEGVDIELLEEDGTEMTW